MSTNTLEVLLPLWQLTTATWPNSSAAALGFYKQYNVSVAALILEKNTDISQIVFLNQTKASSLRLPLLKSLHIYIYKFTFKIQTNKDDGFYQLKQIRLQL